MKLNPWTRFWQWLAARRLRRQMAAVLPRRTRPPRTPRRLGSP